MVNSKKLLTFFIKQSILDVWQGSEYASIICYPMFGKIEYADNIDSVAVQMYSF